jgi:radical SAM protein with 4Fe4S-binding SPASM domain
MSNKFKRIYIEISNICNVQCSFCPVVERDNKIMSLEDFNKVINQIKDKTQEICLHLMGEPLAHPELEKILRSCEEKNIQVQLTTNGILIKKHHDLLVESKALRQINFSLQSYQDNFPDRDLRQYLIPILGFTQKLHDMNPEVYVNLRLWNIFDTTHDNEPLLKEVERFYQINIKRQVDVGSIKSKRIWNKVYLHFDSRFEWPSIENDFQSKEGRCHGLINQLGIHADGTVVPCCLDKEAQINLGNCLNENIDNILNSELSRSIRNGFLNNQRVHDLCQHCSYVNRFSK